MRLKTLRSMEVVADRRVDDGWLKIARRALRLGYADGSRSEVFEADGAYRRGIDAVAVLAWRPADAGPEVLLRQFLRPSVDLRSRLDPPLADDHHPLPLLWEISAGIPEADERGPDGFRRAAARELREEMGLDADPGALRALGGAFYPSGGILTEMIHLFEAALQPGVEPGPIPGDGTPFESVGALRWWPLAEALEACRAGRIADAKTELALWRFQAGWGR
jgi:ADP-ribose pyrophosphatase